MTKKLVQLKKKSFTVEEEELSALMGEKEDYKAEEETTDEEWED